MTMIVAIALRVYRLTKSKNLIIKLKKLTYILLMSTLPRMMMKKMRPCQLHPVVLGLILWSHPAKVRQKKPKKKVFK